MSCSPYFNLNLTAEGMEAQLLSMTDLFDLENDSSKKYDQTFLTQSITTLTQLINVVKTYPDLYNYPMLVDRLDVGPIGMTEYSDFLDATGTQQYSVEYITSTYTPGTSYLSVDAMQYLDNMNTYYTDNFSSDITGGICGLYTKISAIFGKIISAIDFAMDFIANAKLLSIEALIHKIIDTIRDKLLSIINQLIGQINSCLGSIHSVVNTVKDITNFFSPEGIKSLKDTVSTAIADIKSKFEVPKTQTDPLAVVKQTLEAGDYLLYRLCQFTTAVENFMMAPVNALKGAIANCSRVGSVLTNASNQFTFNALTAGAFRMSDSNIDAIKAQLGGQLNSTLSATRYTDNSGAATSSNYWSSPITEEEKSMATEFIAASKAQLDSGSTTVQKYLEFNLNPLTYNNPYPAAGIKELKPSIIILAVRIAKRINKKLIVICAYRSPQRNADIAETNSGVARNSLHMSGIAMDIKLPGSDNTSFAEREKFIKIASQEGAGGIGAYVGEHTFIHIDTGSVRTWNTGATGQLAHNEARRKHVNGEFISAATS